MLNELAISNGFIFSGTTLPGFASLFWSGKFLFCSRSREEASNFSIKAVAFEASEKARKAAQNA